MREREKENVISSVLVFEELKLSHIKASLLSSMPTYQNYTEDTFVIPRIDDSRFHQHINKIWYRMDRKPRDTPHKQDISGDTIYYGN